MKMEEILKLIEAVSASELTDFKYEENGTKLNLKKEQQKVETTFFFSDMDSTFFLKNICAVHSAG